MLADQRSLEAIYPVLARSKWVAMDTEADSLHAYPAKLCLIQVRVGEADWLIDPLAGLDLSGFFKVLRSKTILFHAADYDVRLLYEHFRFRPKQVFDTMIAARLAGHHRFGLSDLCKHYFNETLSKSNQKANWAKRPLSESMEAYARKDTQYLKGIADALRFELKSKGRLEWHKEWCDVIIKESIQAAERTDTDNGWRLKGSSHMSSRELAVLKSIWNWREQEAIRKNRPPFFVLAHDQLIRLTRKAAQGMPLRGDGGTRLSCRALEEIQDFVDAALAESPGKWPRRIRPSSTRLSETEARRMKELFMIRDAKARDLNLDPTLIASKATLIMLSRNHVNPKDHLFSWQMKLLELNETDSNPSNLCSFRNPTEVSLQPGLNQG